MSDLLHLQDGGTLKYLSSFLNETEADTLFTSFLEFTNWENHGGPRLVAWVGDFDYSYSGITHPAAPWTPLLSALRGRVEKTVFGEASASQFKGVLLNLYRDENDSVGMHADNEPSILENSPIASVSLGGVREFTLAYKGVTRPRPKRIKMDLAHGSLLIMGGTIQQHWLHGVGKSKTPAHPRINLTFRQYVLT